VKTKALLHLGALALGLHLNTARAATVMWTGGGDGTSWANAANWSGGAVPGPTSDVVITSGEGTTVVISSGSITVKSIQCSKAFTISGGSLTVTEGASQISGNFTMSGGPTLYAAGSSAVFSATGTTSIDGGKLTVSGGARLSLPGGAQLQQLGLERSELAGQRRGQRAGTAGADQRHPCRRRRRIDRAGVLAGGPGASDQPASSVVARCRCWPRV